LEVSYILIVRYPFSVLEIDFFCQSIHYRDLAPSCPEIEAGCDASFLSLCFESPLSLMSARQALDLLVARFSISFSGVFHADYGESPGTLLHETKFSLCSITSLFPERRFLAVQALLSALAVTLYT